MDQSMQDNMGHLKVMAGIGGVCVQWALLEHLVLGLIATIEATPLDRIYIMFGSLDMKPRLDMAILLARDIKAPVPLVNRIGEVRKALRSEDLADKRNQAVHGVHAACEQPDSIALTMPRWSGPKRTQIVSALDLYNLSVRLQALGQEIDAIGAEIHAWKMRVLENRRKHAEDEAARANISVLLKLAKDAYASAQRFWRNLKG